MTITVDQQPLEPQFPSPTPTLGDAMAWLQAHLANTGKVVVKVEMDGQSLEGPALTSARTWPIDQRHVAFATADGNSLARKMIGKLAALIEYLGEQHLQTAQLIEQGQGKKALAQLHEVLSAWQQVQQAYSTTLVMLRLNLDDLMVQEVSAAEVISDFRRQLAGIQEALVAQDMVLLADILQYEMDGAIASWVGLLEATLDAVERR